LFKVPEFISSSKGDQAVDNHGESSVDGASKLAVEALTDDHARCASFKNEDHQYSAYENNYKQVRVNDAYGDRHSDRPEDSLHDENS
jgi:hypothetical protein